MTDFLTEAMTWALWLPVLPLEGKKPAGGFIGGFHNATQDLEQVQRWWRRWPNANIGSRPPKDLLVIDIDPKNDGFTTWKNLNNGDPSFPDTLINQTGSGGWHLWFRRPHAGALNGTAGAGIDVLHHDRGHAVMPGSIHPDTGRKYCVQNFVPPQLVPVLPDHLQKAVYSAPARVPRVPAAILNSTAGRCNTAHGERLLARLRRAEEGNRNNELNRCAFVAYKHNLDIEDELVEIALGLGLPESEIRATLASALSGAEAAA